ncbi:Hypothetical predicted protein [Pelobates cultripes]|uniref:Uncharacterized protein n=1 Tax=Pelobates cultripes TaxID=61616 RepID=A0AAD1TR01_PELCU|nr:Hypothetical predicted protein [Pelobates cultripes]
MVDYTETYSEISVDMSPDEEAETHPVALKPAPRHSERDNSPVTTAVLKTLLADLQKSILTDVALIRTDLQGLTGTIAVLETASSDQAQQKRTLQKAVQGLQQHSEQTKRRFTAIEEWRWKNNLKMHL